MTNAQQNLENQCSHQFGDGNEMTIAQKIEFVKTQEGESNEKQQTAVEWQHIELSKFIYGKSEFTDAHDILIKAKEMEKEQHATTWDKSMDNLDARGGNIVRAWVDFDDYYEQTYGDNK